MTRKFITTIFALTLGLIISGLFAFTYLQQNMELNNTSSPTPVPHDPSDTTWLELNESLTGDDLTITPLSFAPDHKCPGKVEPHCMIPGSLQVRIKIDQNGTSYEEVLIPNTPITVNGRVVTFTGFRNLVTDTNGTTTAPTNKRYQFAFSITSSTTTQTAIALGETITINGVTIEPLEVLSDSRCPISTDDRVINCAYVGTVKVRARLSQENQTQEVTLALYEAVNFGKTMIRIAKVTPPRINDGKQNTPEEYRFVFNLETLE